MEAIVAVYSDWGIGCYGTQPIVIPADRKRFREITGSSAVLVGRKTMADFPGGKPLPGRRNYIMSRTLCNIEGTVTVHSVDAAVAATADEDRVFVIGGAGVYAQMLPYIDTVYVTKIDAAPQSDAFFPNLDEDPDFSLAESSEKFMHDGISYSYCLYKRTTVWSKNS